MSQFMLCKSEYNLSDLGGTSLTLLQENKEIYQAMAKQYHPNLSDFTFWVMDLQPLRDEAIEAKNFTSSKFYTVLNELYEKCDQILLWYGDKQEGLTEFFTKDVFFDYVKECVENPCCEMYANAIVHHQAPKEIKIIYEDDTELAEIEARDRGCRRDVIVEIGDKRYPIEIISMVRLQQDFELEKRNYGYYMTEPNMLIVEDVTKEEIQKIVVKMYHCKFFERLGEMK